MTGAYYNEINPYAAQWLRNLIAAGHIAPGDVDERSITDVRADDLRGYTQCHFFAGIGGWSYALRLAGWPDDRPVWTGSCPCQPFSSAGKQRGSEDERHLWPAFFGLIRECRPTSVFGEQVAGAAGLAWWDHVAADLEGDSYAAAAAVVGAHSVGAPHIRQRLYWVADAGQEQRRRRPSERGSRRQVQTVRYETADHDQRRSATGALAHSHPTGLGEQRIAGLFDSERPARRYDSDGCGAHGLLGNTDSDREGAQHGVSGGPAVERARGLDAWADLEWIECRDGKARPTQPGIFPLAHGIPARVGRLRAYGNAIVAQAAAVFVRAAA